MSGVFISYRRSDSRGTAGRVYDSLSDLFGPERVFRDIDALEPGAVYEGAIERFISSCDVVVAIIGNQWLEVRDEQGRRRIEDPDDLVRREIEAALAQGKLVVPVLVEDATMPSAAQLPGDLAALAGRNALMVSDTRWNHDIERLAKVVERRLQPDGAPTPAPAARAGPPTTGPPAGAVEAGSGPPANPTRWRTIGLAVAACAVVLLVVVALAGGDEGGDETAEAPGPTELASEGAVLSLSSPAAAPGEAVDVEGAGFGAGELVKIYLDADEEPWHQVRADEDGWFSFEFPVEPDAQSGSSWQITARGDHDNSATVTLEVT